MAQYKNYVIAQTLDEAYALNAKKSTVIVAGNMWLRMCGMRRQTALDLSALGLDFIKEDEQGFIIGAMTTLRTMETHPALNAAFGGVFARAFEPIVGTQFRNGATVGGSVFSRFGFSDVSTLLLAMGAKVVTHARGEVPLDEFQKEKWDRDILTAIRIEKGRSAAIESVCDDAENQLRREAEASGKYLTDRFSPGYGDMPLEQSKGICRVLSADKNIGLTVSQSGIMIPRKSVTAVMGISQTPVPRRPSGCEGCSARATCPLRRADKDE